MRKQRISCLSRTAVHGSTFARDDIKSRKMNEISLRQLLSGDWKIYRDIRLEALKKHPAYFSPSRDETAFSESDWRERLLNPDAATFGLFSGKDLIGISGIFREKNNSAGERAFLVGTYIQENFRRRGLSKPLFNVRIEWARKQNGIKTLVLEHREDNLAVQKAHQRFGFRLSSSRNQTWPDGTTSPCLIYELSLS